MTLDVNYPVPFGAGAFLQACFHPEPTLLEPPLFERLAMNLTSDEIREVVLEIMG